MTGSQGHTAASRVVIRLDANADAITSIEVASLLASALESEILGLFVEDEKLLQLAELPFAQAVDSGGRGRRQLTPEMVEDAFTRSALKCERVLSHCANEMRQGWTFLKKRGDEAHVISSVVTANDLLVLQADQIGFGARQFFRQIRETGVLARCIVPTTHPASTTRTRPVIVIDDGDPTGARTIEVASRIAVRTGAPLVLIAIADSEQRAQAIYERAALLRGSAELDSQHRLPPGAPNAISEVLMHYSPSFVVADLDGEPFVDDRTALQLLKAANAPTVLLRMKGQES